MAGSQDMMIIVIMMMMMSSVFSVLAGGGLFLTLPVEGDECEGKDKNGNYVIDEDGKCVLDECDYGYYISSSGKKCIVDEIYDDDDDDDDTDDYDDTDDDTDDDSDSGGSTFNPPVIPSDEASEGKCYLSRYTDIRLAYKNDGTKALTNSANRDVSCEMSDEEAQCYLDRYQDVRNYAGTDLNGARNHYYTAGMDLGYDFVCPPGKKEIECYMANNPTMASGLSTGGWGRKYNALQHWNNTGKEAGLSYTCT